ncbi:MAG: phosphopantetheine-binding protein [Woeseiaceae bacterium]|nr:phosphopantetheine-binding protein [Woeseiaceae bacterium]
MTETEQALKELIIEALNLEDLNPDDIDTEAPLFGDGLGLDSIDALELGVAVRRKYGVNLDVDSEEIRDHFASVASLARFVTADSQ